jgi:hypothetical protein
MSRPNLPSENITEPIKQATDHPWFERLARLGYLAKGIVYLVIGLLAAQVALGIGGRTTDSEGALQAIVTQPFGKFLLAIVTVGMIGYALWRFVQAAFNPENQGQKTEAKQIAKRLGYAGSGAVYLGLAFTAVKLILGSGGDSGGSSAQQDWTARVLAQPFGQWLVGLAGLLTIGVGLYMIYYALKEKFRGELKWQQMSPDERKWASRIGKFGITARGIVFAIIGIFLSKAALNSDASEVKGVGEALAVLSQQPFGRWLLGFVAFGFIAYSLYCVIDAKYHRIASAR